MVLLSSSRTKDCRRKGKAGSPVMEIIPGPVLPSECPHALWQGFSSMIVPEKCCLSFCCVRDFAGDLFTAESLQCKEENEKENKVRKMSLLTAIGISGKSGYSIVQNFFEIEMPSSLN